MFLKQASEFFANKPSVGGKALNLAKMQSWGLPVPRFSVVSAQSFAEAMTPIWLQIEGLHASIDFKQPASIEQGAAQIQALINMVKVDAALHLELAEWLDTFEENHNALFFAVRSSALNEDSGSDSFAGQFSSYLFVKPETIGMKIVECWASAFNARALAYIHSRKISLKDHKMAVVIQHMIDADCAGVMFSVNPDGHFDELVISAGWGLGEGIVADLVDTDLYFYERTSKAVTKRVEAKSTQVALDQVSGCDTKIVEVASERVDLPCLTDEEICALALTGMQIETKAGHPQDVEWAKDRNGKIWILQCRPITTIPQGEKYLIDNANVSESYPHISKPLTHDFVKRVYEILFRSASLRVGAPSKTVEADKHVYAGLITGVQGRLFYNLSNWYKMFKNVPGTAKYVEVWEEMMGLEPEPAKFFNPGALRALKTYALLFKNYLALQPELEAARTRFNKLFFGFYQRSDLATLTLKDLSHEQREMQKVLGAGWDITLLNDGYTFIFAGLSKGILKKIGAKDPNGQLNDLLAGESSMESARAVASTAKILEAVRADAQLQNRLKLDGLAGIEDYPEFKKQWQEHLFLFGDRCLEELKLETETFRVKPDKFLQMILGYAANHTDLAKLVKGDEARRLRAEREVSPLLASRPLFKKVFEFTLARARQCMINRENSRLDRARMFGILRSIARQMGEVLTRQKILATPSEVFWLEFGELEKFADQRLPRETLSVLLTQRKAQWKVFESMNPEDRFWIFDSVDNSPIPQKRALSQQLQNQKVLQGLGSSAGIARAESLVILSADVAAPARGKILVAPMTDPGWVFLMVAAKGLVSERGSILSHTAIIGRELGIPTVVNVKEVTRIVKSGQQIQINGTTGTVEIL